MSISMNNQTRLELIEKKLIAAFHPEKIVILDESAQHIGHAGAKDGRGHFAIEIRAKIFANKSSIECHQMIYAALDDLMKTDIHALRIKTSASF